MQQILESLFLTPRSSTQVSDASSGQADHRGHAVRLSVGGELDIATVDSLRHAAIGALQLPVRVLILDLHGVTFCGAAGVNALVEIQRAASEAGTPLVQTGIQPPVAHVLELVGLASMIPFPATGTAFPANATRGDTSAPPSSTPTDIIKPDRSRALQAA